MPFTITATPGTLANVPMNRQEFYAAMLANATFTLSGSFAGIQFGGAMPTTNVGLWLPANSPVFYYYDPVSSSYVPQIAFPVGTILAYGGTSVPSDYLACDGSAVSQSMYQRLFAAIGYNYSLPDTQDGSTTSSTDATSLTASSQFRLPDLRGRYPLGAGSGSPNIAGGPNILTPRTLGHRVGQESVAIKRANLPVIPTSVYDYSSTSTQATAATYGGLNYTGSPRTVNIPQDATPVDATNVPPSNVVNFIIRT